MIKEIGKRNKKKIFRFTMGGDRYSNIKGYIGVVIASQFLAEYIKHVPCPPILPYQIISFNPFRMPIESPEVANNLNFSKHIEKCHEEDIKKIKRIIESCKFTYYPDFCLSIRDKLYLIEVKMHKARLKKYQREVLQKIADNGYLVFILYVHMGRV